MIRILLLLLTLAVSPLWAKPVTVTSGEHDGFTRIVLDFGETVDWQFGRTMDGYAFRTSGAAFEYNLDPIFKRIGKSRLAAISAQPESKSLNIGFACACHAIPFEFRPGIIVIDLRDGPPPKGSSFEEALPDLLAQDAKQDPSPAPQGPVYNWADTVISQIESPKSPVLPQLLVPTTDPALQPLRDQLMRQLSRGVSEGVVDMDLPKLANNAAKPKEVDSARISLGEMPGVKLIPSDRPVQNLGAEGASCAAEADLNVDGWGTEDPIAEQFSLVNTGLLGEFDRPNPDAVLQNVRFLIYIGFGLEAQNMIATFMPDAEQAPMLRSMARILDGLKDADGFFAGQISCETPAALWAFLAAEKVTKGDLVNAPAIILAFSNLPPDLRRQLGPAVVEKFLAIEDMPSANTIKTAITRAGGPKNADILIVEAQIDMAQGDPQAAQARLEAAYQDAGVSRTDALIGLVESLVAQGQPIDRKIADELASLQKEMSGAEKESAVQRALSLAQASSGDFSAAFENASADGDVTAKIWDILATLGADADLLAFAVRDGADIPANLPTQTAAFITNRLRELGLPDVAAKWITAYPAIDARLRAQVHLERNDGQSALIAARELQDGADLQAKALQMLGQHAAAAEEFSKSGAAPEQEFSLAKAGEWDALRQQNPNIWTPVLNTLLPTQVPANGPLAAGQELLTNSADTRAAVADLLAKLSGDAPP